MWSAISVAVLVIAMVVVTLALLWAMWMRNRVAVIGPARVTSERISAWITEMIMII